MTEENKELLLSLTCKEMFSLANEKIKKEEWTPSQACKVIDWHSKNNMKKKIEDVFGLDKGN